MSFVPGGGRGNGYPAFPNSGFVPPGLGAPGVPMPGMPSAMPGMPPLGAMPGMPPMLPGGMMGMPPPMPMAPFNVAYPQGQGPLAGRPVTVGANGLLNAPQEEGPEEHEGKQFLQLNVAEGVRYGELWADASDGAEKVTGAQMTEFMQRAKKVSKSQLRTIWQLADHRHEGELGRDEFFIALRLLALAQRGAELSMKGLRNFVGIQLIPEVQPRPKPEPQPVAAAPAGDPLANIGRPVAAPGFSWMAPPELIARYDKFFDGLDAGRMGMIDGKQGLTFFTKSGLPRPTLRQIWQLADITVDGKLDREEFRQAMHLVTGVKNGRITVEQFPQRLHPSTAFWVREIGTPAPPPEQNSGMVPPPPATPPPPPPQQYGASSSERSYSEYSPGVASTASPIVTAVPGMAMMGIAPNTQMAYAHMGNQSPSTMSMPMRSNGSEADEIRAELQKERQEAERVRKEMEEMQAELQRIRLEKQQSEEMHEQMAIAKRQAEAEAAKAKAELVKSEIERSIGSPAVHAIRSPRRSPPVIPSPGVAKANAGQGGLSHAVLSAAYGGAAPAQAQAQAVSPDIPAVAPPPAPPPMKKIEDDDIWNEPSPEIKPSLPKGTGGLSKISMPPSTVQSKGQEEEDSSDDDDFWGMGGAKPTLGRTGGVSAKPTNDGKTGGDALDDWLF